MKWNASTAALLPLLAMCAGYPARAQQRERPPEIRYEREAPGTGYAAPTTQDLDGNFAPPQAEGPSGSSRPRPGEFRYDETGYANVRSVEGGGAADAASAAIHRSLPAGTALEVTSLDSGRTILVLVTGQLPPGADHPIDLSTGAATQLGYAPGQRVPVRLRAVTASGPDMAALRAGTAPSPRADAPPVLLTALRKRLPGSPVAALVPITSPTRTRPAASAPERRAAAATGRYLVQVAALSSVGNAQALARSMGGFVKQGGGLHRVQLGPFATQAQAEAARGRAVRAGHRDARVITAN